MSTPAVAPPVGAPSPSHVPGLDGYRAIAALTVVTTHVAFTTGTTLTPFYGPLLARMDFGVTIFFLLSGFLLYRGWARAAMAGTSPPVLRRYGRARVLRIMPAFVVVAVFTMLVLPEIKPVPWWQWPTQLLLLQIYVPHGLLEGLTQMWSLATEASFYLLLPVIAWVAGRRRRGEPDASAAWQLGVLAALVVIAYAFQVVRMTTPLGQSWGVESWLPAYLDWFAAGMAAAVVRERVRLPDPPRWARGITLASFETGSLLLIACALFVVASTPVAGPTLLSAPTLFEVLTKHALYLLCGVALLSPGLLDVRGTSWWHRFLDTPLVRGVGRISYGVFLWHLVLLRLVLAVTGLAPFTGGFWWLWPTVLVLSLFAAQGSWWLVEKPALRLVDRGARSVADSAPALAERS